MAVKWLLLLLILPVAGAQSLDVTTSIHYELKGAPDVTFGLRPPLTETEELIPDEAGYEPPRCRSQGDLMPIAQGGLRFRDNLEESSCRAFSYLIERPLEATHATISFSASRTIETPSNQQPLMRQAFLMIDASTGEERYYQAYFEDSEGTVPLRVQEFAVERVPMQINLTWWYEDLGVTDNDPATTENPQFSFSADLNDHRISFASVALAVEAGETRRYQTDRSTVTERVHTIVSLPDLGTSRDIHFPQLTSPLAAVIGPAGVIPESRLERSNNVWTLANAEPGRYEIIFEGVVEQPPVAVPGLAFASLLLATISIGATGYTFYSRTIVTHTNHRALVRDWTVAAVLALVIFATIIWALADGLTSLMNVPLSSIGIEQHLLLAVTALVLLLLSGQAIVQRNRALELQHAAELAEANERLKRSNQDLESFASVASHDLQAPLRRVVGGLELFQMKYGDQVEPEAHKFVDMAVDGGKHMQAMVRALLDYGRLERRAGDLEELDLGDVLHSAAFDVEEERKRTGGSLDIKVHGHVKGSRALLRDLFSNLLTNAFRYRKPDEPPVVTVRSRRQDGHVVIRIEDNGRGIDKKHHEEIFEMFRRVHLDADSGTGIGLAICKRIVELHHGTVEVDSAPDVGSTFIIRIPEVDSPTPTDGP